MGLFVSGDCIWLIVVAALWGFTNPFIKQGGKGIEHVTSNNKLLQFFTELKFLLLNWRVCQVQYLALFVAMNYVG
jgi:Putative transmembrane family 234